MDIAKGQLCMNVISHYKRALLLSDARVTRTREPQIGFGAIFERDFFVWCDAVSRIQPDAFETRFRITFFLELRVRTAAVIYKSHFVTGRARVDDEPIRDRDGILELNRLVPPLDAVFEVLSHVFRDEGARIDLFNSKHAKTNGFAFDFADDDAARVFERVRTLARAPTSR